MEPDRRAGGGCGGQGPRRGDAAADVPGGPAGAAARLRTRAAPHNAFNVTDPLGPFRRLRRGPTVTV
ncbi:hypothetical protein MILUP08_43323 [Micromonospora lupini str. Lupac 08]|uniref:Uncharacterized protein n=1 Tax=Micromonospora lupini str. Lupac 08 TaxID=1150864 RepID=I0L3L6_9ACTN|nr:hypothetical protein MILUP08_43323 [Micromonospora lupini str. Lupac 08]